MILDTIEIDYLKEFTTICVGHAANRMAQILPYPVMISIPHVDVYWFLTNNTLFMEDGYKFTLLIKAEGDFEAQLVIGFSRNTPGIILANYPYMREEDEVKDQALYRSMVLEMGNILSSAYLTAAEQFSGLFLLPSIPNIMQDDQSIQECLNLKTSISPTNPLIVLYSDMFMPPLVVGMKFITLLTFSEGKRILDVREVFTW